MDDLPAPPPRQPDPTLRGELERSNRRYDCERRLAKIRNLLLPGPAIHIDGLLTLLEMLEEATDLDQEPT